MDQGDPSERQFTKWTVCALSNEFLQVPIVADALGNLFNKDTVLQKLLEKALRGTRFSHIRNMKDLTNLNFTANDKYDPKQIAMERNEKRVAPFICPVTRHECNGVYKFSALKTCGCVFADQALREVKVNTCMQCGKAFTSADILRLNPTEEELVKLRPLVEEKRSKAASRSDKRAKPDVATSADTAIDAEAEARRKAAKPRVASKLPEVAPKLAEEYQKQKLESSAVYASLFAKKDDKKSYGIGQF
eukprot:TRINITY_DN2719_c0_g2_i1.p1 TRINITY_DN2719_c0_g2~~TRINITY_DN2719_c0_g2_i1.p1  ORF type:complete len:277 (+),score=52.23 TRINITY_DN2719_c0_g2_i1:93-833(+)